MPIQRGEEWGHRGAIPAGTVHVLDDAELARASEVAGTTVTVAGGDLARTLGLRGAVDLDGEGQLVPIDGLDIELEGGARHRAVAHVIAGRVPTGAHVVALMNGAFYRGRNLAPRAHPGDGRVDIVTFDLTFTDRLKAWRRMRTGTHVPHPGITAARRAAGRLTLPHALPVWVDGHRVGRTRSLAYRVVPDVVTVVVS